MKKIIIVLFAALTLSACGLIENPFENEYDTKLAGTWEMSYHDFCLSCSSYYNAQEYTRITTFDKRGNLIITEKRKCSNHICTYYSGKSDTTKWKYKILDTEKRGDVVRFTVIDNVSMDGSYGPESYYYVEKDIMWFDDVDSMWNRYEYGYNKEFYTYTRKK